MATENFAEIVFDFRIQYGIFSKGIHHYAGIFKKSVPLDELVRMMLGGIENQSSGLLPIMSSSMKGPAPSCCYASQVEIFPRPECGGRQRC